MNSQNNQPLVIFELANNHMGNVKHAKKIINEYYKLSLDYRKYGIDFAFKFQFRDLDTTGKLILKIDLQSSAIDLCSCCVPWADLKFM